MLPYPIQFSTSPLSKLGVSLPPNSNNVINTHFYYHTVHRISVLSILSYRFPKTTLHLVFVEDFGVFCLPGKMNMERDSGFSDVEGFGNVESLDLEGGTSQSGYDSDLENANVSKEEDSLSDTGSAGVEPPGVTSDSGIDSTFKASHNSRSTVPKTNGNDSESSANPKATAIVDPGLDEDHPLKEGHDSMSPTDETNSSRV